MGIAATAADFIRGGQRLLYPFQLLGLIRMFENDQADEVRTLNPNGVRISNNGLGASGIRNVAI